MKFKHYVYTAILSTLFGASLAWGVDWYTATGAPAQGSSLSSATIRSEYALIQSGISDKLPPLTGNGSKIVVVNAGGTGLESLSSLGVAQGGTGATSLTDGGVLLGSGTGAFTAMAVLADGEMIVGDGTTDPVAESGATLRTSIGLGTASNPQFNDLTVATLATDDVIASDDVTATDDITLGGDLFAAGTAMDLFFTPSGERAARVIKDGGAELYYNNIAKAHTSDDGFTIRADNAISTPPTANPGYGNLAFVDSDSSDVIGRFGFFNTILLYVINDIRGGSLELGVYDSGGNYEQGLNVAADGALNLYYGGSPKISTATTGATVTGTLNATTDVTVGGNSVALDNQFAQSLATEGYQKFPGGLTIQWGDTVANAGATGSENFPLAFTTIYQITGVLETANATSTGGPTAVVVLSNTGVTWRNNGSINGNVRWIAIGII